MNILITGVNGFVGSNLVKDFKLKHNIYGLDIVTSAVGGIIETYSWDNLDVLPAVDVVIHLAGMAHDTKNLTHSEKYFDINTGLTQKIFDWFLQSEAKKFIHFSSVKAVADKVLADKLTEDVIPNPVGPYGMSKLAAEKYILDAKADKLVYILRPCMIHGPGNKGNLNLLYNFVLKGIPYPLGKFENKRSFTSIDNLSYIVERLIENNIQSGVYNIADDEAISTNELITLIANTANKPVRIWKFSPWLIRFAANTGACLHFTKNKDRIDKLTANFIVSNKKIKDALKIDKMPVDPVDGLKKTILSFNHK
ncbi:MAG: NAD-dependent epimerase/dehydratase family protein [Bacteroidetes bacterium]|jgi:nucleoside-diphosphate-sugar epimerase|nr:NAD-dependent epimerase/dehydratase family protein [Bacteroidota bacterium]